MTDAVPADSTTKPDQPADTQDNFFVFLLKLALIVVIFRSFVFAPFNIPSESMMPRLLQGDYLLAAKWPYGYSRHSLPFSLPLIPGRLLASQPERGDVVIFKAPPSADIDYIKRVIGLPGDQVQMQDGKLYLNGEAIPKVRVADLIVPVTATIRCYDSRFETRLDDGRIACRYAQYRETLPGGPSYNVLDVALTPQDDTGVVVVPEGSLFLMGDNRDNSLDSRFPAVPGQGIGIVPQAYLVGKASVVMFSTDGNAQWLKPWTWFTAARWSRIGGTF
jgi:signal peptidase I